MNVKRTSYESNGELSRFLEFETKKLKVYAHYKSNRNKPGLQELLIAENELLPVSITTNISKLHLLHDALGDVLAEHEAFSNDYGK